MLKNIAKLKKVLISLLEGEEWALKEGITQKTLIDSLIFDYPKDLKWGDLTTNFVWRLKDWLLNTSQTPAQLAKTLADFWQTELKKGKEWENWRFEAVGNGYINVWLPEEIIYANIEKILDKSLFNDLKKMGTKSYLVEYSSPNVAKPFTIGHLRSTIIGDCLANLLEATGQKVYRDNHLGDWGTQFGKQIYALENWMTPDEVSKTADPVKTLVELYVRFHQEAEKNEELDDEARKCFKRLEEKEEKATALWQFCIDISRKEWDRIYKRLNIRFTENKAQGYGESYFEDKMGAIIDELESKGLLLESKGAKMVFFEGDKYPPLMILKKDGATLYATRDLATDKFRWQTYGNDLIIVNEVGSEQSLYFKQLFETEKMLGWYQDERQRVHVGHGLYRFKDRKMSTRKGDVIWLDDVLDEAFRRVSETSKIKLSDDSVWKIAIGAIKWNDLSKESERNVDFDLDQIVSLKGNSGPYMQYTAVRAINIARKMVGVEAREGDDVEEILQRANELAGPVVAPPPKKLLATAPNSFWGSPSARHPLPSKSSKQDLLQRTLMLYPDKVRLAAENYAGHILANYLYELAGLFNSFYAAESILENREAERLTLAVARVLQEGLGILGIELVSKM